MMAARRKPARRPGRAKKKYMVSLPGSLRFFTTESEARTYARNYLVWLGYGKPSKTGEIVGSIMKVTVTPAGGFGDPMSLVAHIRRSK
jgi:hypothetical protein